MNLIFTFRLWRVNTAVLPFQLGLTKIEVVILLIIVIAILISVILKKLKRTKAGF